MNVSVNHENGRARLSLKGRFDFTCHRGFKQAYEDAFAGSNVSEIVVDMGDVEYLDSSALGMLLLLRDHAGGDSSNVLIVNCNPDVKKILAISNFEQLFTII